MWGRQSPEKVKASSDCNFLTFNFPRSSICGVLMLPLYFPCKITSFACIRIFLKVRVLNCRAFLKTGIILRSLHPAHSHGVVTFLDFGGDDIVRDPISY